MLKFLRKIFGILILFSAIGGLFTIYYSLDFINEDYIVSNILALIILLLLTLALFYLAFVLLGNKSIHFFKNKVKKENTLDTNYTSNNEDIRLSQKSKNIYNNMNNSESKIGSQSIQTSKEYAFKKPLRNKSDENLSDNFFSKNYKTIKNYEDEIYEKSRSKNIEECLDSIYLFEKFQDYCFKSKGGKLYFEDMWLFCHNSSNPCFSFKKVLCDNLKNLCTNTIKFPNNVTKEFLYYNSQTIGVLKSILKSNDLKVSGKKQELIERLISNNIIPDEKYTDKYKDEINLIDYNRNFIKNNERIIELYSKTHVISKNIFKSIEKDLKDAWGFIPKVNDVIWGSLENEKLNFQKNGDKLMYKIIQVEQIKFLESEGRFEQAKKLEQILERG